MILLPAEPLVFGEENGLMGWVHSAAPQEARDLGVVVCAPQGYDSLCVHWGLRLFAERLAIAGLPTVRFDYHGTGDSLGDDGQPDRVNAWLASIDAAVQLLKEKTGVRRVALLGLRLGATLAAAAAADRGDIEALVMYGPSLSGRTYVREQKALGSTRHPDDPVDDTGNPNDVLMAGWLITEETATALGKLDVAKLSKRPAKDVLILHREDFPLDERPQKNLAALGADVTAAKTQDWVAFMQDALTSKEPTRDFDTITRWLLARSKKAEPAKVARTVSAQLQGDDFTEEPLWFSSPSLFGVLTTARKTAPGKPLLLFLNTAANHHIGPHRSTVELARMLSGRGISSFRLDAAGLGDTPARPGRPQNGVYSMEATRDAEAAIDFVHARGFKNVSVAGLCSGGYLAFHTSARDKRVKAMVLINLQRFIWKDGDSLDVARRMAVPSTGTYLQRALQLENWARLVKGGVDVKLIGTALATRAGKLIRGRSAELLARLLGPSFETNEVPRGFLQMLARGTRVLLVYGESDGGLDELALHLGPDMRRLRGQPNAELAYLSGSDHTLTTHEARRHLLDLLARTLLRS